MNGQINYLEKFKDYGLRVLFAIVNAPTLGALLGLLLSYNVSTFEGGAMITYQYAFYYGTLFFVIVLLFIKNKLVHLGLLIISFALWGIFKVHPLWGFPNLTLLILLGSGIGSLLFLIANLDVIKEYKIIKNRTIYLFIPIFIELGYIYFLFNSATKIPDNQILAITMFVALSVMFFPIMVLVNFKEK